jgi:glycosyltransferase involved in cell wall biosynthesis
MNRALGASIAICCHNSAELLPATLDHFKAQQVPAGVRWEVLVVDNASTYGTGEFATEYWGDGAPVELRMVSEPRIGLTNARYRAFQCAGNEIISFVDDDNCVSPDWIAVVSEIMSVNPDLGVVGSFNDPVADSPIPACYDEHASHYYAIERECDVERGNVPIPPMTLTGAGENIRKQAWLRQLANGFVPSATDRVGKKLSGCGDRELTLALHLAGWRLDIDRRLRFQHYMPKARLERECELGRMLGLLNFRSQYTDLLMRVRAGKSILEPRSNEPTRNSPSIASSYANSVEWLTQHLRLGVTIAISRAHAASLLIARSARIPRIAPPAMKWRETISKHSDWQ